MRVTDKIALITGGLSGIGLAVGKELLRNGAKGVALVDINIFNQKTIIESIEAEFGLGKAIPVKADVTQLEDIIYSFDTAVRVFGNLDIVLNCAGVVSDDWEKELDVNYKGAYNVFQQAMKKYLPKFKSGDEGVLINVASVAGLDPMPMSINYSATKAALIQLSRGYSFPYFYEKYKVKIFTICPGLTETPIMYSKTKHQAFRLEMIKSFIPQTAEQLAVHTVAAIETSKNGDVYIIEDNKIYKKKFDDRSASMELFLSNL